MGRPNIALLGEQTIFTPLENLTSLENFSYLRHYTIPVAMFIIATLVLVLVYRFLSSEKGLAMRATGANPRMAKAQGIAVNRQVLFGHCA